jgi:hypothetical protein
VSEGYVVEEQQKRSARNVLLVAGFLALGAALYFGLAEQLRAVFGVTPNELPADDGFNPAFAIVAMIVSALVFITLGRRLLADSFEEAKNNSRHQIALYAALVLSAISFFTTAVGLFEFTEPENGEITANAVSWILSYATTAGVQILMLVVALELGDELLKLKPVAAQSQMLEDQQNQEPASRRSGSRAFRRRDFDVTRTLLYAILAIIFLLISNLVGLWSMQAITNWWNNIQDASVATPKLMWLPLLIIAAGVVLKRLGHIRNVFGLIVLLFLGGVYTGALAVSSTFSFDAYYRFVQSEQQIELEQSAIVAQETSETISSARDLLVNQISVERARLERSGAVSTLQDSIGQLIIRSEQNEDKIFAERERLQDQITRQFEEIDRQREEIRERRLALQNQADDIAADIRALRAKIPRLQSEIPLKQAELERADAAAQRARKAADDAKFEAEAQREGLGDRIAGEGPRYRAAVRAADAAEKSAQERESDKADIQADITTIENEIAQAEIDITRLQNQVEELESNGQQTGAATQIQQDLEREEENLRQQVLAAEAQQNALQQADTTAVSQALSRFLTEPAPNTLNDYEAQCSGLRKVLIDVGADLETLGTFQCLPGEIAIQADRIFDLQNRLVAFAAPPSGALTETATGAATETVQGDQDGAAAEENQSAEVAPPPTAISRYCDDGVTLLSVREALALARRCVELIGSDVTGQPDLAGSLTLTESIYLKPGYDIRKSISNIFRLEPYAVSTAGFAVFIDLFILFVGIYIAYAGSRDKLAEDHRLKSTKTVSSEMRKIATEHSSAYSIGSPAWAMREFLNMSTPILKRDMSERGFTSMIELSKVSSDKIRLVEDLTGAAGATFVERSQGSDGADVLYLHAALIDFIREQAYDTPLASASGQTKLAAADRSALQRQRRNAARRSQGGGNRLYMGLGNTGQEPEPAAEQNQARATPASETGARRERTRETPHAQPEQSSPRQSTPDGTHDETARASGGPNFDRLKRSSQKRNG